MAQWPALPLEGGWRTSRRPYAMHERGYIMKITFDIDCTPAEAREFMGLPDIKPMQAGIIEDLQKMLRANPDKLSPESGLRSWPAFTPGALPATLKSWLNPSTTGKPTSGLGRPRVPRRKISARPIGPASSWLTRFCAKGLHEHDMQVTIIPAPKPQI